MTNERMVRVLRCYDKELRERGFVMVRMPDGLNLAGAGLFPQKCAVVAGHCLWMIPRVLEFVKQGKIEKAHYWMGFIQMGMLMLGLRTIDEMRAENRGDC